MIKKESIAIVPGSFDPITNGHLYVIKEARKLYDKIYVAVMINSEKNYTFSLEERKRISDSAVTDMDGVEVISYDGWLYELANSLKADAIVKGYRNDVDVEYEQKMAKEIGLMTINEMRREENMNYIEGLDVINVGLGAVLYDTNRNVFFTPNTGQTTDLEGNTTLPDGTIQPDETDEAIDKVLIDKDLDTEFEQDGNSSDG